MTAKLPILLCLFGLLPASVLPAAEAKPLGILVDAEEAEFTGAWVKSTKQPALVGSSYRHDDNRDRGQKSARFTPEIPAAGQYEVRLLYVAHGNRAFMCR